MTGGYSCHRTAVKANESIDWSGSRRRALRDSRVPNSEKTTFGLIIYDSFGKEFAGKEVGIHPSRLNNLEAYFGKEISQHLPKKDRLDDQGTLYVLICKPDRSEDFFGFKALQYVCVVRAASLARYCIVELRTGSRRKGIFVSI